jgi:hypothetical protein
VNPAPVAIPAPDAPDLRDDVQIAVPVHVADPHVVAAEPRVEDHAFDEADRPGIGPLPHEPAGRRALREDRGIFLLDREDVPVAVAVEVGVPERVERSPGAGGPVGEVVGAKPRRPPPVVLQPGGAGILAVAVGDDDVAVPVAVQVVDPAPRGDAPRAAAAEVHPMRGPA